MLRKILEGSLASMISRCINLLAISLTIPLIYSSLGNEGYGSYAIVLSFSMILTFADFGFGSSIVNIATDARRSIKEVQNKISSMWWTLICSCGIIILSVLLLLPFIRNAQLTAILISIAILIFGTPATLFQRLAFAENRIIFFNSNLIGGRLLSLASIYLLVKFTEVSLIDLVFATLGVPILITCIFSTYYVIKINPKVKPSKFQESKFIDYKELKKSLNYSIVQICSFLEFGLDTFLVGFYLGKIEAANFDVIQRLFIYIPVLINIVALQVWPTLSNWISHGNKLDIRTASRFILLPAYTFIAMLSLILAVFHSDIASVWIGVEYEPEMGLAISLALLSTCISITSIQSSILNVLGEIKVQASMQLKLVLISIPLKISMLIFFNSSAMVASFSAVYMIKIIIMQRFLLKRTIVHA